MRTVFLPTETLGLIDIHLLGISLQQHVVVFASRPRSAPQAFVAPERLRELFSGHEVGIVGEIRRAEDKRHGDDDRMILNWTMDKRHGDDDRMILNWTIPNPDYRIVFYDPPSSAKHHFLSLSPLELDISSSPQQRQKKDPLIELMRKSIGGSLDGNEEGNRYELRTAVDLINSCTMVKAILEPSSTPYPTLLHGTPPPESIFLRRSLRIIRHSALTFIRLLRTPIPFTNLVLADVSAIANQFDVRAEQAAFLPTQLFLLRSSSSPSSSTTPHDASRSRSRAQYINFFNTIWLISNDLIVGQAFGTILQEQASHFGLLLGELLSNYTVQSVQTTLLWLDGWPGGIKLNTELSAFISSGFVSVVLLWDQIVLQSLLPHLPNLLSILGLTSHLLGTTFLLSFSSDLLSLLTLHLYLSYLLATLAFRGILSLLSTLFHVFRGKRTNVLRGGRMESAEYGVDQMLLGTVLFTLFSFLFPTVLAYYLCFAVSRLMIIFGHATLDTCLAFMNHFPLFAMMLRLKDPARLPGGIDFDLVQPTADVHYPCLKIRSQPIQFSRIFFQHLALWRRLCSHYSPIRLIRSFVVGEIIGPIERYGIRY